jgi:hypothetical protein
MGNGKWEMKNREWRADRAVRARFGGSRVPFTISHSPFTVTPEARP